uniref:Uncharacterized protein n=1 Tax=Octopus bimaculoides TaxID=37653 RepID=A0A0L8GUW0_OCTBM
MYLTSVHHFFDFSLCVFVPHLVGGFGGHLASGTTPIFYFRAFGTRGGAI